MSQDRRRLVEDLFEEVLDHPRTEWDRVVEEICGGDEDLAASVRKLLGAHLKAEGVLERSFNLSSALWGRLEDGGKEGARAGEVIGRYRILQEIGRGGMGKVFLAERADGQFRRRVALKLISESDPDLHQRVVAERQILASLEHPNIGRLLDGGVTEAGRPYLVMEYVNGLPINRYCDRMRLTLRERLRLFLTVLEAVEHAHHNLVVHRDLKPSNILVTPSGEVKLLDFGIAKLLNPTLVGTALPLTRPQDRALTPEYASPEQVRGEAITTAADIYSLEVVLYEILSGHRPYAVPQGALPEVVRVVCEEDPAPPSQRFGGKGKVPDPGAPPPVPDPVEIARARHTTSPRLRRQLSGDLDAIVMKSLRKEPLRRYRSVELLRQDILHYLEGRPVEASRGNRWYRVRKTARRHRGEVLTAAIVAASLVVGVGVASWQAKLASRERDRATEAIRESEAVTDFLLGLFQASDPWESPRGEVTALDLLSRGVARANELRQEANVHARMLQVMAQAHANLGRYDEEEALRKEVVELLKAERGEEDPAVIEASVQWGTALSRSGRYDSAGAVLARVHDLQEHLQGPISLPLSATLEAQARVDVYLGDLEAAEARTRESLAIRERLLGPASTETITSLGTLASILRFQARYAEAEDRFREVLARRRRLISPDPVVLSSDMLQIAMMLVDHGGDLEEAEALCREALSLQEPAGGGATLNRVWALTTLAEVMQARGDHGEAERLFREAVEDRRRTFGDLHPLTAESLGTLGIYLRSVGRLREAEELLRQATEVNFETVGPSHTRYAGSLAGLASVLLLEGALEEADSLALESLRIRRDAQGPAAIPVAETLTLLAEIRIARGLHESAESLLLQALEITDERPADAVLPRRIHGHLADLYQAMGRPESAARHRGLSAAGS
jgi:serine/threonine-protein kinase